MALALKTLCGFGVPEIARAFVTNEETINKRLYRAREAFRELGPLEIPSGDELAARLEQVLSTIYLLFNEGYHATSHDDLIREDLEYGGLRLRTTAALAGARIGVVIDIGFGDAVEPGIEEIDLPVLLDLPAPHLRAYARETVIAEKFQAMIAFGRANSRMKDFYDVWVLAKSYHFNDDRLARAIAATFDRRGTPLPAVPPDALTAEFASDEAKRGQWNAFSANTLHLTIRIAFLMLTGGKGSA